MSVNDRPLVIQTEHLDERWAGWLAERTDYRRVPYDDPAFKLLLPEAAGLVIRTYTQVDEALLALAPKLKVVGRAGVALENVDLHACAARGVTVVHTPGANTQSVVELVTAFMLDALRPRLFLEEALPSARWLELRQELIAPRQLADCTLGIVGFGRIGTRMAEMARALRMRAVYSELREIPADRRCGAEPVDLEALLSGCEIVTVHVDDRPSNRGFLDERRLGLMQEDVVFINTSRGFVIDPLALARFLGRHPSAQAILDVHEPEPVPAGHPLLECANCRLTPHIGAATATAHANMSAVVQDIWRVLNGEAAEGVAKPKE